MDDLTMRDKIAIGALQSINYDFSFGEGCYSDPEMNRQAKEGNDTTIKSIVDLAYRMADAMLARRAE